MKAFFISAVTLMSLVPTNFNIVLPRTKKANQNNIAAWKTVFCAFLETQQLFALMN